MKKRKVRFSLRNKIIILIFSLIIVTMGVVLGYTIKMNIDIQDRQVKANARKVAESLSALRLVTSWDSADVNWQVYEKFMEILSGLDRNIILMAILDKEKEIKAYAMNKSLLEKDYREIDTKKKNSVLIGELIETKLSDSIKTEMAISIKDAGFASIVIKFSKKAHNRALNIMILNMIILTIVLLGAGFGGAWMLANIITRNFNIIALGMRKVAQGNLDVAVNVKSNDETGVLADDFNRMLVELKEKVRIKDAFETVADGLKEMEDLKKAYEVFTYQEMTDKITKGYYPPPGSDSSECSFVFIDISGFSGFTFELVSEDLKDIIKKFVEKVSLTAIEYQGAILKVTERFILIGFGYPFRHEDDEKRALISTMEIRKELVNMVKSKMTLGCRIEDFNVNFVMTKGTMTKNFVDKSSLEKYNAIMDYIGFASKYGQKKSFATDVYATVDTASGTRRLADYEKVDSINMAEGDAIELFRLKGTRF
ncbi:MAG TPA: adenylate/guanylate cyclase domain-containing protein [bacterium]|nr:adenylate/guanylate cyclase domain-containing protein [bacterium]